MPLIIEWSSSGNVVAELLTTMLVESPDVAAAGMQQFSPWAGSCARPRIVLE